MTATINIFNCPADIASEGDISKLCNVALGENTTYELSIEFMSDDDIQALNKQFRQKDKPTNVLSFPNDEGDYIGDIAISVDTVTAEADSQKKDIKDHLLHMVVHGTLHLLGYDHESDADAEEMEALEIKILDQFGINNPYL